MRPLFILISLVTMALPVAAQTSGAGVQIDNQLAVCKSLANATLDIDDCYHQASVAWDAELNRQYQALLKGQSAAVQSSLRESQRAWLSYQQHYYRALEAFYQQQQGTVWQIIAADSKLNVIREKALDLERLNRSSRPGSTG